MTFSIPINTPGGTLTLSLEPGSSAVFVGANGGGKTRLAVLIERSLGEQAHRISAHRALALNPSVAKIQEHAALSALRFGYSGENARNDHRESHRWQQKAATYLLNDYDFLLQAMFAEQTNRALKSHKNARASIQTHPEPSNFERLAEIWERLLPHRRLNITGDDIDVNAPSGQPYKASDMSDGERAIFYMIGQALTAAKDSVLIVDEPELHVHRSIMSKLWDELESARHDCAFVFITHDLEFAAARVAQKFVIKDYHPKPEWTIEAVPATGFSEELTTLILGSRRPILFVEGTGTSLDYAIYRGCFSDWTVVFRGSCEEVIHSVATMRRSKELTRITCAGIVDADFRTPDDVTYLKERGVSVLPVAEIENLFLLPEVSRAILESEGYAGTAVDERLALLNASAFAKLTDQIRAQLVKRYCLRRVDKMLRMVDLSVAANVNEMTAEYAKRTAALDISDIANEANTMIEESIRASDLTSFLKIFDHKGLLALAAQHLKGNKRVDFESWLMRVLRNDGAPGLVTALKNVLPNPTAA